MNKRQIAAANNRRARRALVVLQTYEKANDPGSGVDTAIKDLLTDLMHWGSAKRRHSAYDKFEGALATARDYFATEQETGEAY